MEDTLEQTEQAAAQLLAAGFQQSWEAAKNEADLTIQRKDSGPHNRPVGTQTRFFSIAGRPGSQPPSSTLHPTVSPLPVISGGQVLARNGRARPGRGAGVSAASPSIVDNSQVHPVVRLGWRPLCSVVCNGLRGEFLGGHDRDMFIQCTSAHYAGLPLVDISLGGCIMTCSQFERAAGRELSKKWKESLHVVGLGEGSRATLLSWLKRHGEQDFGSKVIGSRIWVCWFADADYYLGTVVRFNRETGKHTVQYSSRLIEDLHLPVEMVSFDHDKPALIQHGGSAVQNTPAVSAPTLITPAPQETGGASPPQEFATQHGVVGPFGLWNQDSCVSVSTSFGDELNGARNLSSGGMRGLRPGNRRPRPFPCAGEAPWLSQQAPPKRALSAPATVILAEVAAAAQAMAEDNPEAPADPCAGTGTMSPITPGMYLPRHAKTFVSSPPRGEEQQHVSPPVTAAPSPIPVPLPVPPPPVSVTWNIPKEAASAVAWMHRVCLALDTQIQMQDPSQGSPSRSTESSPPLPLVSFSGRFQALLALLRPHPLHLEGLYEAMALRYAHFQCDDNALMRRKMSEFVVSTVLEATVQRELKPKLPEDWGQQGVVESKETFHATPLPESVVPI